MKIEAEAEEFTQTEYLETLSTYRGPIGALSRSAIKSPDAMLAYVGLYLKSRIEECGELEPDLKRCGLLAVLEYLAQKEQEACESFEI